MHVCVLHVCLMLEEGNGPPGIGITDGYELYGYWELNWGPRQEQQEL